MRSATSPLFSRFQVNADVETPFYLQIIYEFFRWVIRDKPAPGESIPSISQTAANLQVNLKTVHRAYEELGELHAVKAVTGNGTFVGSNAHAVAVQYLNGAVSRSLAQAAADAVVMGWTPEKFVEMSRAAYDVAGEVNP
jgi:DNA-binding transcriptional regulator YhcF (GntR family)